jgi:hypothetical protein
MIGEKELAEAKGHLTPAMRDELFKFASYIPYV